jgi:hypothetical protein
VFGGAVAGGTVVPAGSVAAGAVEVVAPVVGAPSQVVVGAPNPVVVGPPNPAGPVVVGAPMAGWVVVGTPLGGGAGGRGGAPGSGWDPVGGFGTSTGPGGIVTAGRVGSVSVPGRELPDCGPAGGAGLPAAGRVADGVGMGLASLPVVTARPAPRDVEVTRAGASGVRPALLGGPAARSRVDAGTRGTPTDVSTGATPAAGTSPPGSSAAGRGPLRLRAVDVVGVVVVVVVVGAWARGGVSAAVGGLDGGGAMVSPSSPSGPTSVSATTPVTVLDTVMAMARSRRARLGVLGGRGARCRGARLGTTVT